MSDKYKNVTIQGSRFPDAPYSSDLKISFTKEMMDEYIPTIAEVMKDSPKGFRLLLNEEYNSEWNSEGVMFEGITRGTRNFPSSFDYKITPDTLKLKITFSASGLDSGNVYNIPYTLNEKQLTLNYYGQESIYK